MISMSMIVKKTNLEQLIENLRKEMINVGIQEGLMSEKTIKISQKLDIYIAVYQTLK